MKGETRARRDIVIASLLFVAGFSTVFVALGATASVFGALAAAMEPRAVDRRRNRHHR